MNTTSKYIVQYVGFATTNDKDAFIKRWAPFANQFKSLGIKTIDLYEIVQASQLNFISRNVWDQEIYFQNFPTGMAGSGSGGGISVTQFGGYWLQPDQLQRQDQMKLVFLDQVIEITDLSIISRLSSTINIPYKQMLDLTLNQKPTIHQPSLELICNHIQTM
jgi:hypothetical protein